jgi:hypothetical protein
LCCHFESNPPIACAYFFFDGRDGQKGSQTVESLVRSLIRQFSAAHGDIPAALAKLYHSCHDGGSQPSVESLQSTLLLVLEAFGEVYIVLDALDECAERKDLLKWIKAMTSWRKGKLHLLATSRPEATIAKILRSLDPRHVHMEPKLITGDIERYIHSSIDEEEAFERWDDKVKMTIKSALLKRAVGMYVCFDLEKCRSG